MSESQELKNGVEQARLKAVIERAGGQMIVFKETAATRARAQGIQAKAAEDEPLRQELLAELKDDSTPAKRYELEYKYHMYDSFKPGVDDEQLSGLVCFPVEKACVIEIGGGPAYIAARGQPGLCLDLNKHPHLHKDKADFMHGDACQKDIVDKAAGYVRDKSTPEQPKLAVLSYCLDRVPDQAATLANFAAIIKATGSTGLITVCLSAVPESSGIDNVHYSGDKKKWVTKGQDAIADFEAIAAVCRKNGLNLEKGGQTTHYGTSLDGYEELACYVLVLRAAEEKK